MTTPWLVRSLLVGALVLLLVGALTLMRRAWRAKAARQLDIPPPRARGTVDSNWVYRPVDGRYLSSTRAGDWLDRIVVHSMGVPSNATMGVSPDGVWIERQGGRDIFIPDESLDEARLDRAISGKVYEQGGVVVVTWRLGEVVIDTGFRAQAPERHEELVAAINAVVCDPQTSAPPTSRVSRGGIPGGLQ